MADVLREKRNAPRLECWGARVFLMKVEKLRVFILRNKVYSCTVREGCAVQYSTTEERRRERTRGEIGRR